MIEKLTYINTSNLLTDTSTIIESAKNAAFRSVNVVLVQRNWLLGKRIAEEQLGDQTCEELYGQKIVETLAQQLTEQYGSGFDRSNLYLYVRFYQSFPNIVDAARQQSFLLTWTHYRILLQVDDEVARKWYENEAAKEVWSTKTLQRNISSQYYYRLLKTPAPDKVKAEMQQLTQPLQDKNEFIKNPIVAEFLGLSTNTDYTESTLEKAILTNLQKFLMELGKGYAFVARQQHIRTEKGIIILTWYSTTIFSSALFLLI
jgi:predicted nuclease of restriction endonuclease-like (RecB) superfamily